MRLEFGLHVAQKQGLALTAQVQQAIKLLHMTNLEIGEFVAEQLVENPFIEDANQGSERTTNKENQTDIQNTDAILKDAPHSETAEVGKLANENQFETGDNFIPKSTVAKANPDFDLTSLIEAEQQSLYGHVLAHIETLDLCPKQKIIAVQLTEHLEPTGWITDDLQSIAERLDCLLEDVKFVLARLQEIEPAGLFATTLKECLALQVKSYGLSTPKLELVLENLHLMGSGKFDLLKRRCKCNDSELRDIFKIIKSLDPKPGLKFDTVTAPIREPDLIVYVKDEGWEVELNNSTLPNIYVNKEFTDKIKSSLTDQNEKEFLREKLSEAKWLTNAIAKRNETMLKVGSAIIKRQKAFLEKGAAYIQPMVLNDIAEDVGMHESTISRVTTGSLMQTPRGTLELKYFFSVGVKQGNQEETTAATSIRYRVKKLIEEEDKGAPLSDDLIVEILRKNNVEIARRTVAKYRKMDNIPSSFARKRRHVISGMTI